MNIYLIKRPIPADAAHWHETARAAFKPVILCANKAVAKWQAGATDDRAWVWENPNVAGGGWLLCRWNGLDIDYGHVVRSMPLPDGRVAAFEHPTATERPEHYSWDILPGATWWSSKPLPLWLRDRGVVQADDEWSLRQIAEDEDHARQRY